MPWYELSSAEDPKLAELAARYNLHPLHLEDARSPDERIKVDQTAGYTFAVLKPVELLAPTVAGGEPMVSFATIDIFAGYHEGEPFFITVADENCQATKDALARARREGSEAPPARLLYLILDTTVDLYFPAIDHYDDRIDELEDRVIATPEPDTLQQVFAIKRQLIDLRRILVGTRDATLHLQRDPGSIVDAEHQPFVRDIYDHTVRLLDSVETQRDLVNNALDIYLSSVANRTNEVMKVLTVLGTIALPAIAISGIYGMNLKGLPFEDSAYGAYLIGAVMLVCTVVLLVVLKRRRWF
jgi:magnesium transporter